VRVQLSDRPLIGLVGLLWRARVVCVRGAAKCFPDVLADRIDLAWSSGNSSGLACVALIRLLGVFPLNGVLRMSAQIIKLSDHRKMRPPAMPKLMSLPLSIFAAYLVIATTIYEVTIEAALQSFER
jgi:hypothetical protein